MKIQVTQNDIDLGKPQSCIECPIALAVRRAGLPGAKVAPNFLVIDQETWRHVELPGDARVFITKFDAGDRVEPFEFDVEEP